MMTAAETDNQIPTLGRLARRTASTVLGALQNRAELFTLEFEEENNRVLKIVVCAISGVFLAMLTLILLTGTVIFLMPQDYRVYAAAGFAVLYLIGAGAAAMTIKNLLKTPPFVETLGQLRKDTELLDAFK
jgi:uncharacterized membrane protein YqjE